MGTPEDVAANKYFTPPTPTEEQIMRLWEWCGLRYNRDFNAYSFPDGSVYAIDTLTDFTNPVILGLLFKWAVPQTIELIGNTSQRTNEEAMTLLFSLWLKEFWTPRPAPISIEDALFWAIDKIRKGKG